MSQQTSTQSPATVQIIEEGNERKYWTQIPNIIFTLGLSPFELTLYVYLKKVAGEAGACWQTTDTLVKATRISGGMLTKVKAELSRPRVELNGKALIVIAEETNRHGGKKRHVIRLTDIWPENMTLFAQPAPRALPISQDGRPISPHEIASSSGERAISPHEIKKNPSEEKPREEKPTHDDAPPASSPRSSSCGSIFSRQELMRYARNHPEEIHKPGGWATAALRTGEWDEEVAAWFKQQGIEPESNVESITRPAVVVDSSQCPDCQGLGFTYPNEKNPGAGVKKCHHPKLRSKAA